MNRLDIMNELVNHKESTNPELATEYGYSLLNLSDEELNIEYESVFEPKER